MSRKNRRPTPDPIGPTFKEFARSILVWRTGRLLLLLWLPALVGTIAFRLIREQSLFQCVLYCVFTSGWGLGLYYSLTFGIVRTNLGTYSRLEKPVQFWTMLVPFLIFHCLMLALPFLTFIPISQG